MDYVLKAAIAPPHGGDFTLIAHAITKLNEDGFPGGTVTPAFGWWLGKVENTLMFEIGTKSDKIDQLIQAFVRVGRYFRQECIYVIYPDGRGLTISCVEPPSAEEDA